MIKIKTKQTNFEFLNSLSNVETNLWMTSAVLSFKAGTWIPVAQAWLASAPNCVALK